MKQRPLRQAQDRPFKQVDVFTATPYLGNPLAVVLDGSGLDDAAMQRFARWTNLSETTFLLPPTDPSADYRVRIFTPGGELPFAGHPTLGSCHSWLQAGGKPHAQDLIVQECKVGLIRIRRELGTQLLAFAAPPLLRAAPDPVWLAQVATAVGLKAPQILAAQLLDNGPMWLGLLLNSVETVLQLAPNHLALEKLNAKVGVAAIYPREEAPPLIARANREARAFAHDAPDSITDTPDLEVRAFAAAIGINEDPVTGSLNASLAQWLIAEGHAPERYVASQGVCLGRAGQVHIERDASGQVWVGGESVTCIDGTVTL
ncbi:MAG TPA: phenazine biosynthesis protein PhzF [Polaromonas sp.]|uniref:PhzF family phenazine biosynthesis protein n=1 Tax=Polaromonas sp. UBA4122 TaxID=1947074 RepID=UPI000ED5159D|nr:PhzF family phenazine biosynthesis protein [Polaromonas sp. UBA4122]HAL39573.1 phenazine biosynthesis protein PhzF [Polaromonas sp.]